MPLLNHNSYIISKKRLGNNNNKANASHGTTVHCHCILEINYAKTSQILL